MTTIYVICAMIGTKYGALITSNIKHKHDNNAIYVWEMKKVGKEIERKRKERYVAAKLLLL